MSYRDEISHIGIGNKLSVDRLEKLVRQLAGQLAANFDEIDETFIRVYIADRLPTDCSTKELIFLHDAPSYQH